jgi:hypothetical protein
MLQRTLAVVLALTSGHALSEEGDAGVKLSALLKGVPVGGVALGSFLPGLRGYALDTERARLEALPALARCDSLECLTKALKKCEASKLVRNERTYGCGLGAEKERRVGWYAVARHPAGGCGVLVFAGRGERVVADRWCRAVPFDHYEFACPDEAWVTEGRKRDAAMRASQKKAATKRKK